MPTIARERSTRPRHGNAERNDRILLSAIHRISPGFLDTCQPSAIAIVALSSVTI